MTCLQLKIVPVLLLCIMLLAFAGCTDQGETAIPAAAEEFPDWTLTLDGTVERVLTLDDLRALTAVTGNGFAVSTVGIKYGPYRCEGVDLRDLAGLVGGVSPGDQLWVSAPDGYLWVFDYDQLEGEGFITFNADLQEIPSPDLRVILMYAQDEKPLSYNDGGPCRIAIISQEPGVVTEGSAWVKWVDRIEVHRKGE